MPGKTQAPASKIVQVIKSNATPTVFNFLVLCEDGSIWSSTQQIDINRKWKKPIWQRIIEPFSEIP